MFVTTSFAQNRRTRYPSRFQERGATRVRVAPVRVLPSIHLDHEAVLRRAEVNDERADRMLSPELRPRQAAISELEPESSLERALVTT